MNKLSISFLVLAVTAGATAIINQINKRGGMKPAIADLKAGTASAVEAVKNKKPIFKLVTDNTDKTGDGGSIEGVRGELTDEQKLADEQADRAYG